MIKTIKVKLKPSNEQQTKLFQFAGASRFAYNWALQRQEENYKQGNKFINNFDLRKEFTKLKQQEEYKWLYSISCNVTKQAIKDLCSAYEKFFKHQSNFPRYKSRKRNRPSFFQDPIKIKFLHNKVKIENLEECKKQNRQKKSWVKLTETNRIPINTKYYNPHITFDGKDWYISVGIDFEDKQTIPKNDGIGIDLGLKDFAICSDNNTYKNINKTKRIRQLEKKKQKLQKRISKQYLNIQHKENKKEKFEKGDKLKKTNNIIKNEKKLISLTKRLTNIRHNYLHQITSEIVKREPSFIVMEDLNVKGMMKNKHLSKVIQQQCFYEFRRQIEYKSKWNNIVFIKADRFYPSSKLCSKCGCIKKDLKLSDRIYHCNCGNIIDRDYQASINLKRYGEEYIKSIA